MQGSVVVDSTVNCTDGKGGSVSHVVIDPRTSRLGYIEVQRGLIFTRDHCVPAGDIQMASPEAVTLSVTTAELDELPPLQAQNPATGFYQRSIPESYISLGKRTAIEDSQQRVIGYFHGVNIGPDYQVESILLGAEPADRIPIAEVTDVNEDRLVVQRETRADQHEPTAQPVTDQPGIGSGRYSPTAQQVLTFLRNHPGALFTAEDICERTDCSTTQARMALDTLARDGMIDREQTASGVDGYVYRQG